ncbi:hypothetical protein [Bradyrhizobium cenepequi]
MAEPHQKSADEIKTAALRKAKSLFRGATGLSRALAERGARRPPSPQAISQWEQVPVERVADVESATGISRHLLRPDIYGLPSDPSLVDSLFEEAGAEG